MIRKEEEGPRALSRDPLVQVRPTRGIGEMKEGTGTRNVAADQEAEAGQGTEEIETETGQGPETRRRSMTVRRRIRRTRKRSTGEGPQAALPTKKIVKTNQRIGRKRRTRINLRRTIRESRVPLVLRAGNWRDKC